MVIEAMDELEIDIRGRRPKGIDRADVEWADVVVTMGCGDACPVLPGKEYLDWELTDPIDLPLEAVRGDPRRHRAPDSEPESPGRSLISRVPDWCPTGEDVVEQHVGLRVLLQSV